MTSSPGSTRPEGDDIYRKNQDIHFRANVVKGIYIRL
jgi:hypothetical protein